ncbi:LPXTG cell wall anchor domain-containing protein [Lacticaseibacillus mingshuiensis]|uniref:LPXTG cell wall anchor domain-containing protein n=1 Tax=Lacticaseibacillus mingshuiensis TaxID=2799574 RepID=UPI001944EC00|nr:LPXTG cell wall anchor domain-containing protein [Lacticaseibacillus mingshuiensis]
MPQSQNANANSLPQTGDTDQRGLSTIGAMLLGLSGILALFGLGERKRRDDK